MKKSLLALAVLGAFAGAASAQSSVTLYGRVDLSVGKPIGTANKGMFNGSGSRFGVRGVEDLGGGLKALFQIEHRFDADTGGSQNFNVAREGSTAAGTGNRFWGGRSIVGVEGGFGQVLMGREYTVPFFTSQLAADPWGWDTIASQITIPLTGGSIVTVRNDSSLTYRGTFGGFTFGLQTAERTDTFTNRVKRPVNVGFSYAGGPVYVGFGHEVVGNNAKWTTANASVRFGAFKPGIFIGSGNPAAPTTTKHRSVMLTGVGYFGAGELRLAFGKLQARPAVGAKIDVVSGGAIGYHHNLSKRTTVYVDVARNSKAATQQTGYDFGLKHNF